MTCPQCTGSAWALYICDDSKHRCWQCKATGKGRITVHGKPRLIIAPAMPGEKVERLHISRRGK